MILIERKDYLYKRVKQNAIPYSVYRAYCNTLGKKVNKTKVVYLKNEFQTYTNNIRATWKLTLIVFLVKKNSHDLSINQNDTLITNHLQLTNLFNKYFSQIGSELRQRIPNQGRNPL